MRYEIKRAAHFAPLRGNEIIAYWIYQLSNIGIFVYLFFLKVRIEISLPFCAGTVIYFAGLLLCALSMKAFAAPSDDGLNTKGLYGHFRNPMYLSYFLCFTGCALLTRSLLLFGIVLIFQAAAHWIILSEERWCIQKLGDTYKQYMKKVRRYI